MIVLGTSFDYHDAAAALLVHGKLVAACQEERLSKIKHDASLPVQAIESCLRLAGIRASDIDVVAHYENPIRKFDRILWCAEETGDTDGSRDTIRAWFAGRRFEVRQRLAEALGKPAERVHYIDHHLSHAASAFYLSPFDRAAVVTLDGVGEYETAAIWEGDGMSLKRLAAVQLPHSLGLFYSAFTAFLGFEVNEGEYKVMGMAGFGKPTAADEILRWFKLNDDGTFTLDQAFFEFLSPKEMPFNNRLVEKFGSPRLPDSPFRIETRDAAAVANQNYADIAASVQHVTETVVRHVVTSAARSCATKQVCLAGGVALNSLANGRLVREQGYSLFVQPAAGDAGGALGAAAELHHRLGGTRLAPLSNVYLGNTYSGDTAEAAAKAMGCRIDRRLADAQSLVEHVAGRLSSGEVGGWFQGRAEWGPRALGNRSILADPTRPDIQRRVNEAVKHREPFRPFAPSVLAERAHVYFEMAPANSDAGWAPENYMLCVHPVRPEWRPRLPAITHVDGTARVHTVWRASNALFYDLLAAFERRSGVPVLLDTSFNLRGDPIVETPEDAIRTFLYSDMDFLVIGHIVVTKG